MKNLILALLTGPAVLFIGCAQDAPDFTGHMSFNETYVRNMKMGYVCPDKNGVKIGEETRGISSGNICRERRIFKATGEQSCIYAGRRIDCTWYGYSFDFEGIESGVLDCIGESSMPLNNGNPKEVLTVDSQSSEFELELPGTSGHFYNPLYAGFTPGLSLDQPVEMKTTCSYLGEEIFSIHYLVIHPASP